MRRKVRGLFPQAVVHVSGAGAGKRIDVRASALWKEIIVTELTSVDLA
jgi:hypothetical protein